MVEDLDDEIETENSGHNARDQPAGASREESTASPPADIQERHGTADGRDRKAEKNKRENRVEGNQQHYWRSKAYCWPDWVNSSERVVSELGTMKPT